MVLSRILIFTGFFLILAGVLFYFAQRFFGFLPGDFLIKKGKWIFSFPLATSLIISIFLTVLINLFLYFFRS